MSKQFDYRLLVKVTTNSSFTPTTVLTAPRECLPADVLAACQNVQLEPEPVDIPAHLLSFARYLIVDFFAVAHRTGLYNRQRFLWEAIARVTEMRFKRPQLGFFNKVNAPYTDLTCIDHRGQTIIWATLLDKPEADEQYVKESGIRKFVEASIERAEKIKKGGSPICGVMIGLPMPIGGVVLDMVARRTGGNDPVARYESVLREPLACPLDLFGFSRVDSEADNVRIQLCHPQLKAFAETAL